MLGHKKSLLFPRLVHLQKEEVKDYKGQLVNLYRLDWSGMEKILQENYEASDRNRADQLLKKWEEPLGATLCPPKDPPFFPALPAKQVKNLDSCIFNIKPNYRNEILRNAKRAVAEHDIERKFDTNIREMCQQTVEAHVEVAFSLLADCFYDINEMKFSRDYVLKFMMPKWMLFRFWFHQTGWGLVWDLAKFNELEDNLNDNEWCERVGRDSVERYNKYLLDMQANMEDYEKHIGWDDCNGEKEIDEKSKGTIKMPVDAILDNLLEEFTELYRRNSNIVSLDVAHVNSKMPFELDKSVTDIAYVFSRRNNMVPDMVIEGEKITVPNVYSIKSKQEQENSKNLCKNVEGFVNKENRPYILKVLVDEKDLKIGAALIQF